ncbi:hypothetical protein NDU88_002271 [Pleurodeles waltl]|uniref:Uncharacterized protein n=1 Tax=Pleurodeles waltl TaxID=8319 RepID=A0AAV7U8T4_PLEWA|nr:hypothetical protein NDU88_002271 [Pleurodeles waltl]
MKTSRSRCGPKSKSRPKKRPTAEMAARDTDLRSELRPASGMPLVSAASQYYFSLLGQPNPPFRRSNVADRRNDMLGKAAGRRRRTRIRLRHAVKVAAAAF